MITLSAEMDESSSLLDLLECSVCLERLDTTAKVLPCQHTFCRRCLENILSSRNELRCPECRILVDCGVDDLPANILLVRLLDGIRQRPQRGNGAGGGGGRQGSVPGGSLQLYAAGISASPPGTGTRELPLATRNSPVKNIPAVPCGKALYSYEGKEPGDLQFAKGDVIVLRRKVDDNWYHGELGGCHGFLPASYIQLLRPLSQTPPQGKALYDFEVKDKDQDKDSEASPSIPTAAPHGRCIPDAVPRRRGAANATLNETGKKNAKKRHSFTALSISQRAAQLSNSRHSMEISHPDVCPAGPSPSSAGVLVPPRVASVTSELLAHAKVQLPLNIYLALYAYKPQKADELELRKGEMYRVTEKCQDGWFKGTSLRTGATGVFPGNYVTPVSRRTKSSLCFFVQFHIPLSLSPFFRWGERAGSARGSAPGGTGQPGSKVSTPSSSPGSPGPSSSRPSTPLGGPDAPPVSPPRSAAAQLKNCLRSCQPGAHQARSAMQLVHSPPAGSPERPPGGGVSPLPLRPQSCSSPSRPQHGQSPGARPLSMVCGTSPGPSPLSSPAARHPLLPLSCLTPPNASAALLNGGDSAGPSPSSPAGSSPGGSPGAAPKPEKKEKKAGGLLKLLSGAAAKKKSRSTPSSPPTHEPRTPSGHSLGRAGSCPIESESGGGGGAAGLEPLHRKSGSLDTTFPMSPPPAARHCGGIVGCALLALRPETKPLSRERYRVVVPYPPQSEAEIELREGDVVFVHKRRDDGWYKGTLQRTGRTGLFPGSFVESF
ncbi:hypothetical protein NHX12_006853 [Muraenolepis orangiensis]|uniref:RING-type E3 ubiquitin transferase n=1 Tax=Muraenolepis orangiensis TaxID=630683 RepID=A0A9Q0DQ79_9TELE|nr:hypothetical protein NHX12_006853 [Muraenolepis orangiensis]